MDVGEAQLVLVLGLRSMTVTVTEAKTRAPSPAPSGRCVGRAIELMLQEFDALRSVCFAQHPPTKLTVVV